MTTIDAFNLVLAGAVKWALLCVVALILVARSRNTSAATLHLLLLVSYSSIIVFVAAVFFSPLLQIPWLAVNDTSFQSDIKVFSELGDYFLFVYILGFSFKLVTLISDYCQAFKLSHTACREFLFEHQRTLVALREKLSIQARVRLRYSHKVTGLVVIGWKASTIVLPETSRSWSESKLRRFLLHELAHVQRRDWAVQLFLRLLATVFWFAPFNKVMLNRIEWYCELACDDVVLAFDRDSAAYAHDLLTISSTGSRPVNGVLALLGVSEQFERISAVIDSSRIRQCNVGQRRTYLALLICVLIMIAGVQLVEQSTKFKAQPSTRQVLYPLQVVDQALGEKPFRYKGLEHIEND